MTNRTRRLDSKTETIADCRTCGAKRAVTIFGEVGSRIAKCSDCGQVSAE